MSGISIVWTGEREFAAHLHALTVKMETASRVAVDRSSMVLIREAKRNASGPPRLAKNGTKGARPGEGPGVVTGRLRNSITVIERGPAGRFGWQAKVGPTVIYARRLELGFTGTDSLGRHYNQPPYPFMAPAFKTLMAGEAERIFREAWAAAARA